MDVSDAAGSMGATGGAGMYGESGRLAISVSPDALGVAVTLDGELDLETAQELDRRLAVIEATGLSRLLIDLRGVSFMDSTGLSSIVRAHRFAESNGHTLVLRRGSNQVRRLFALTGMDDRLSFEGD
jgi:anti-sigma B factor antagonist